MNPDGFYSFDPTDGAYDHLREGETRIFKFPVTLTSSDGDQDTADVTITVTGTNDAPVAQVDEVLIADEGSGVIEGVLAATDPDDEAQLSFVLAEGAQAPAGFTLNPDGSYRFDTGDAAYQQMNEGDSFSFTLPVTVTDEHGASDTTRILITIQGTNDKPVASAMANVADEGGALIQDRIPYTDVDNAEPAVFSVVAGHESPPGFVLEPDGSYRFDPADPAYEHLSVGDTRVLRVPVAVTDAQGGSSLTEITLTIHGTNDVPVADSGVSHTVTEFFTTLGGSLGAHDVDDGAQLTYALSGGGQAPVGFTLDPDGSWSFDPRDEVYTGLQTGETRVLTIPVSVTDEHGASDLTQIQITVIGHTNQAPVASAAVVGEVVEGGALVSGKVTATDADEGDTLIFSLAEGVEAPAGFTIAEDGSFTFDPGVPEYDHMNVGDSEILTIPVVVMDKYGGIDTTHVQLTVTGTNDLPSADAEVFAAAAEGAPPLQGRIMADDVDAGARLTFAVESGAEIPPGFSLGTDGRFSFDPSDAAYDHMAAGDTRVLSIPVTVTDEHGASASSRVTVTVTGTNDAPVAGAGVAMAVDEGGAALTGQLSASDVDDGAVLTYAVADGVELPAGFVLDGAGSYHFDPAHEAYDYLQPGERLTLAIPVTVSDEHGARDTMQLTITVTGTNDVPVAEPVTELTAWEGGAVISGVVARDADLGSVLSVSVADGAQLPAGFTFESDGSYRFDPADSAYDYLRPGEQRVETVPVVITDEHGASVTSQITITIQGTNDKPVATSTAVVAREGAAVMHGQLQATDVESPTEAITFQLVGNPPAGFTLNSDGSYTFDPSDPAYDYLKAGGFRDTRLRIKATDEDGGSSELLLRLWMTGTNDAPVAGAEVLVDVDEGAVVNGKVSATDVDQRAVLTYS
ncbi:MAG: hypothetical protein B0D96_06710, partial [Candidatus Sedimenticola endophacoides]